MSETRVVNLTESFAAFDEQWSPRIAADLNDQQVRLAKLEGSFAWHAHPEEDELFLVHRGRLRIDVRDRAGDPASERSIHLGPGEFVVIPRGVEHFPVAEEEVEVVLFEPASTVNTGTSQTDRTIRELKRL